MNKINNSTLRSVVLHATKIIQIHKEIDFDYQLLFNKLFGST